MHTADSANRGATPLPRQWPADTAPPRAGRYALTACSLGCFRSRSGRTIQIVPELLHEGTEASMLTRGDHMPWPFDRHVAPADDAPARSLREHVHRIGQGNGFLD